MREVVIIAATRTAIGAWQGALSGLPASELGACVIRGLLERSGLHAARIDEVILGQVLTAGCGQNPARQAALRAGLPHTVPAMTLNKVCGSGLKAVQLGAQAIAVGDAELVIAGGMESMSRTPYLLAGARDGLRMGAAALTDSMLHDGLWDAFNDCHLGITAENLAEQYGIGREEQDLYALRSRQRAVAASTAGRFAAEITPLSVPRSRGEPLLFCRDEQPRDDGDLASLTALRPAFRADGTVTAGNASPLNDGAAAVLLASAALADSLRLPILGRIAACASAGVEPAIMGIGPVFASCRALEKAGWNLGELDLIEVNEAFAAQALAVGRELHWDDSRVNVNGGAIALGHPLGASGCRILVSLLHEMQRRGARKGLATLCVGGGQGVAMAVERS